MYLIIYVCMIFIFDFLLINGEGHYIMKSHYKVIVVGAGTAGITVASRLLRQSDVFKNEVAIFDPADVHYYQPLWTLVGAGVSKKETSARSMESLIPNGAVWVKEGIKAFNPEQNEVRTEQDDRFTYDYLVVAAGIEINWGGIKGLEESLGKNGVCSNYSEEHVEYTWEAIRNFKGGNAIFTHPNAPVKCGGAPQKIVYLAEEAFVNQGVRDDAEIIFALGKEGIFDVPQYAEVLTEVIERKNIDAQFQTNLVEVDGEKQEAVFENLDTGEQKTLPFNLLHASPPMRSPQFIRESPLACDGGWVDVHKYTLQHTRYENVFGLGDNSNLPTSKTGAAIRKQAPVVVENMLAHMRGQPLTSHYDGYTSCPLVTGYNSLVLAEFGYDNALKESMPFSQAKERRSMYLLKKDLLPIVYWNGMLKGVM